MLGGRDLLWLVSFREANPHRVSFGGVVRGESAMKTEEEIGSLVNYTFRVCRCDLSSGQRLLSFKKLTVYAPPPPFSDQQLVGRFRQIVAAHPVAQIQQQWQMASVPGESER